MAITESLIALGISQANAFVSVSSFISQVNVTVPVVATTVSTRSLEGIGISEANSATIVNPISNFYINVTAQKTNATASSASLTTRSGKDVPIYSTYGTNFLLMENGIDTFLLEDSSGSILLEGISGGTTIVNASAGSITTKISSNVALTHATTSVTVNPLGNLYINTAALTQVLGTTSVHASTLSISTVPFEANTTATASSLRAYGLSVAKCSITVQGITPQVNANAIHVVSTTGFRSVFGNDSSNFTHGRCYWIGWFPSCLWFFGS